MTTDAVALKRMSTEAVVDRSDDGTPQEKTLVNARSMEGGRPSAMKVSVTLPLLYLGLVYVGSHVMVMDLIRCVLTETVGVLP